MRGPPGSIDDSEGTLPTADERRLGERDPSSTDLGRGQLGKYRIVQHLGRGGMGSVYHAVHTEIGKEVALKVLRQALAHDPRAHARFLAEAANLSRLTHPHVVGVIDFGTDAETPYLVMELLRGEDLACHLGRSLHGLSLEDAIEIMLPVCSGIIAAHHAGIIHRDIKPTNIFLAETALNEIEPKVLDFGIAKVDGEASDVSQTRRGALVGTPQYISPEQIKGNPADARSDQYALGVVLYECITGRNPFDGQTEFEVMRNIVAGHFHPLASLRPDVPRELEELIMRAMNGDPRVRFPSVYELGRALLPFAPSLPRARWSRYFALGEASLSSVESWTIPKRRTSILPPPEGASASRSPASAPVGDSWYVNSTTGNPASAAASTFRTRPRGFAKWVVIGGAAIAAVAALAWATAREAVREPQEVATTAEPSGDGRVTINITGLPADATVLVDGSLQPLPVRLERSLVARKLRVEAPGFPPQMREVVPSRDQEIAFHFERVVAPAPSTQVSVSLDSSPSGAGVWVNGGDQMQGRTPVALATPRSSQPIKLTFRLAGHKERTIVLVPDTDRAPATVHLEPLRPPRSPARPAPRPPANRSAASGFTELQD